MQSSVFLINDKFCVPQCDDWSPGNILVYNEKDVQVVQGRFVCSQSSIFEVIEDENSCQLLKINFETQITDEQEDLEVNDERLNAIPNPDDSVK